MVEDGDDEENQQPEVVSTSDIQAQLREVARQKVDRVCPIVRFRLSVSDFNMLAFSSFQSRGCSVGNPNGPQ